MARILVLGGTGFVGPFVVKQLLEQGDDVTLFHRGSREPPHVVGAKHVHGDFARLAEHVSTLATPELDVVIDVNPGIGKGGHGVLHFAGSAARGVVLTSLDVYRAMSVLWGLEPADRAQEMPVHEDSELRTGPSPDLGSELAFDNLAVEEAVAGGSSELPVTVLRCPIIYGPLDTQRRLGHYVRRMVDGRPAIVLDARLARLRLTRGYVENVAAAVVKASCLGEAAGRTYNVGEPDALTEAAWVHAIAGCCSWDGEVVSLEPSALPAELQVPLPRQDLYADTSRIRQELQYAEAVNRNEGLRRAVDWERAQQQGESPPDYAAEDAVLARLGS